MAVLDYVECKGKKIALDEGGYLANFDEWDEDAARALAEREGMEKLDAETVEILKFVREYYRKFNFFPILNAVCKNVRQPKNCVNQKFMNALTAWKVAGLPKPEEPVISLLEAGQSPG